jgi:peptidoglycan/xylan/chitin deacetylase (PgdA/CDA1 family)
MAAALWAAPAAANTTVSLTFDNGTADQMAAVPILADHGMEGTFYVSPARIGRPTTYMSWAQVQSVSDAGNEIGGLTQNHAHLGALTEDQQRAEICGGRQSLLDRGYSQVSFAYPYSDFTATSQRLVQECGYLSGRDITGLGKTGQPKAETIPPLNPWAVRTRGSVDVSDTLAEIEDWIMGAEAVDQGNGVADAWMNLVFTHLCDPAVTNCADPNGVNNQYITPSDFDALLDWLQARGLTGTQVKTIGNVMDPGVTDATPPVTQISCDGGACQPTYDHSVSATLSATDTGGSGLKEIRYTTDGTDPTTSSPLYAGPIPVNSTTTIKFRAWDNAGNAEVTKSQTITIGTAAPDNTTVTLSFDDGNADQMPAVQMLDDHGMEGTFFIIPGRVDRLNSPYMTWAQVQTIYDHGNEIGGHTQNHLHLPTLPEAQQRSEICDGRQALLNRGYPQVSFAYPFGDHDATSERLVQECGYLSGRGVSGLGGTGEPKAETIPPSNRWVIRTRGSVDVNDHLDEVEDWIMDAEAASRNTGAPTSMNLVFHHLCDPAVTNCADPNGVDDQYMTPSDFDALLSWLQARESTGTAVKTIGEMMAGQPPPQDTTPPATQIMCDGAACQSGFYNHAVSTTLSATDTGGSGLKEIRYMTDGTDPTASSPLYPGPIPVNSTTTIKFRAWDNAGNAEAVKSQTISIDTAKPTSAIKCDGAACSSVFYNHNVSATLSGSDTGGSGLKNIRYTTNGSTPTGSSPVYTGPISVSSTTTIRWRAEDNVGNLEAIRSQTISIDKVKPTSTIRCNGAACKSSIYSGTVSATLSATDTGGAGVKNIRYTTNGSTPTSSSPVYTGPINVSSTKTITWRAEDNAGNVESIHSQQIRVR